VWATVCGGTPGWAVNGNSLALNSGSDSGSAALLANNGYAGTYITLAAPGDVTVTVNASGTSTASINPHMNIVINDESMGFDVGSTAQNYQHTFSLPAGTHFIRTEMNNDPTKTSRSLSINSLDVAGASISNSNSSANALAAANTYIDNYRKGPGAVRLLGAAPGTLVDVKLKRHDFNFGTIAPGSGTFPLLNDNPTPGTSAYNYQQFVNSHFNSIVPSNGGKWTYNEPNQDQLTLNELDKFLDYAEDHDLRARMHNVIWDTNQQPYWVCCFGGFEGLLETASGGGPGAAAAKAELRQEIIERIDYYVRDRGTRFVEIDVLNESLHRERYWEVFGADGIAEIYNEVADSIADSGGNATAMLNEFNVLQYSENPLSPGSDPYANWYREHNEEVVSAGGTLTGVGIQYYADRRKSSDGLGSAAHSAARIQQVYQNLSVADLPIALTEFDVINNGGSGTFDWTWATQIMEETMRMTFGTPDATSFMIWGIISNSSTDFGLVDSNYLNPTAATTRLEKLMDEWDTDLQMLPVAADGTIDFSGFYGDYEITIGGQTFDLQLLKGTTNYELAVAPYVLGDYNGNGVVDAADYTAWRDALTAGSSSLLNDPTPGTVDESDFSYWRAHFGETAGSGAGANAAAVPEPASAALLLLGLIGWHALVAKRRGHRGAH
jgi:GH35 family endo-1,4-beta-xylanase